MSSSASTASGRSSVPSRRSSTSADLKSRKGASSAFRRSISSHCARIRCSSSPLAIASPYVWSLMLR